MKIVFDFDHTLFSTRSFYEALRVSFEKLGIARELFLETFEESKQGKRDYNPQKQFELILERKAKVSLENALKKTFQRILNKAEQFLYPDTLPALRNLKKSFNLILLSYGQLRFQREKIKKSKIEKYFDEVLITKEINKTFPIKKFLNNKEKTILVEDNPTALSEIKKTFPGVITIRINRGEGKYAVEPDNPQIDFSIKNLKELGKILRER